MASKAHVFPNYSYGGDVPRQRRPVVFQTNDPVVLPRSRSWGINGGLLAAAAAATLLVAGATYAVFYTEPARLAQTPTASIEREYVPDADLARVNALKALGGPAAAPLAAPTVSQSEAPAAPSSLERVEPSRVDSGSSMMPPTQSEVLIDDSAPGVQESLPQPAELAPSTAPYPNPTTTPPDAIAPSDSSSAASDSENPYR